MQQQSSAAILDEGARLLEQGELLEGLKTLQMAEKQAKKEKNFAIQISALVRQGEAYLFVDRYSEALNKLLKANRLMPVDDSAEYSNLCDRLVEAYSGAKKWKQAKKCALDGLVVKQKLFGNLGEAKTWHVLARICMRERQYGDAQDYLEQARKVYHPDSIEMAQLLDSIAIVQCKLGETVNSLKTRVSEMELWEILRGSESEEFASAMHRCAIHYSLLKRYGEAVNLLKKTLEIREKILGHDDQRTVATTKDIKFYHERLMANKSRRLSLELEDRPRIDSRPRRFSFAPFGSFRSTIRRQVDDLDEQIKELDKQEQEMKEALDEDLNALEAAENEIRGEAQEKDECTELDTDGHAGPLVL